MTSSLPDFSACSAAPAATSPATLAELLPGLDCGADPTAEFADLLVPEPVGAGLLATAPVREQARSHQTGPALVTLSVPAIEPALAVELIEEPAPADETPEIPRDTLEQAAAFVTALLQTLFPGVQLPALTAATNPAGAPRFSVAADGVLELKLTLPSVPPAEGRPEVAAETAIPAKVSAEVELPGGFMVRLEAMGAAPAAEPVPPAREIFAGKNPGRKTKAAWAELAGERNFVFTGDKQVKLQSPDAGITVAKSDGIMPAAPTEESRFARKPGPITALPARSDLPVVVLPPERLTVPAAEPAVANFAGRAVETVTNLVEAQFSASMQKSGSVQLRLQFGGEDLRVRVELRDGAVHTDFRTDSAELRTALTREWQTVAAAAPEQALRYLDPVFSSAPASGPSDSQSQPGRHQPSQQDLPPRAPRDPWNDASSSFTRRTQLTDAFVPEPPVTRGPVFLPTSSRLSVHA